MRDMAGHVFRISFVKPRVTIGYKGRTRYVGLIPGEKFVVISGTDSNKAWICQLLAGGQQFMLMNPMSKWELGGITHTVERPVLTSKRTCQPSCSLCTRYSLLGGFCTAGKSACSEECYDPA